MRKKKLLKENESLNFELNKKIDEVIRLKMSNEELKKRIEDLNAEVRYYDSVCLQLHNAENEYIKTKRELTVKNQELNDQILFLENKNVALFEEKEKKERSIEFLTDVVKQYEDELDNLTKQYNEKKYVCKDLRLELKEVKRLYNEFKDKYEAEHLLLTVLGKGAIVNKECPFEVKSVTISGTMTKNDDGTYKIVCKPNGINKENR